VKVIKQSWQFEDGVKPETYKQTRSFILKKLESAGRTCYKSEDKITDESCEQFIKIILDKNHESVLEHCSLTTRIVTDRGVSHELVRHRIASYSQESTRYANYSKDKFGNECTFILPVWFYSDFDRAFNVDAGVLYSIWEEACIASERYYMLLLEREHTPQQARTVLNNSLKTEIVVTMNLRSWKHFFQLRCSKAAHPQMRELALSMLEEFYKLLPPVFELEARDHFMIVK
jgi:thymidylate synthase (FAD)